MKSKSTHKIIIALACIVSLCGYSQKAQVAKADQQYEKYAYVDAIKAYERLFEKGYKTPDMLQKLGNSYYFKAELDKAAKWYGELFQLTQELEPEYYYRYAQSLKAIKDYKRADEMLAEFHKRNGSDLRGKLADAQKDYLAQIQKNSGRFVVENTGINSKNSDYGSAFMGSKVIFTSARDTGGLGSKKHTWTNEGFTNLYSSEMGDMGVLSKAERFNVGLDSKFHESTPIFTKDGKTVYFTRNNYLDGKKGKDASRTTLLKIYKATLEGNKWKNVVALPFNSDSYSVAHPALSKDEQTLYFASDMPGSLGQSDIFKVSINSDGSYGQPVNLGNVINTEGRETFPFISEKELYFASDGHPGLGGLDIFVSKLQESGTYKQIDNVGEPINTSKDDFAFIINATTRRGYVSSNRDGGMGGDDIYKFLETKRLICEQYINGIVTDKATGLIIADAKVTLSDANFNVLKEMQSDAEGKFDFGLVACDTKFYIKSEKEKYNTVETSATTGKDTGTTFVPIEMEKTKIQVKVGDDLFKKLELKQIYFDLDKSNIRPDAAIELTKILTALEENPTMEIDIRSHTDCRSSAKYNAALSDRRAKSTRLWLVDHGIGGSRMTAKGYGESQLVNNCACEPTNKSACSEEEHQANRRSEFIITKM